LASLSVGRIGIINICVAYITKAVPIAIRYTAVRKQFGPPNSEELPVLEYQLVVSMVFFYELNLHIHMTHHD